MEIDRFVHLFKLFDPIYFFQKKKKKTHDAYAYEGEKEDTPGY